MKRLKDIEFQTSDAPSDLHRDFAFAMHKGLNTLPLFNIFLPQMAQQFGCTAEIGPLKDMERAWTKILTKYNRDVSQLCDIVRGMLIVEDDELDKIKAIAAHFHPSVNVATRSFDDKFDKPSSTGLRCLQIQYEMSNGHVAEIMVLTRSMRAAYAETHDLYKTIRSACPDFSRSAANDAGDREQQVIERARRLHENATTPALRQFRL